MPNMKKRIAIGVGASVVAAAIIVPTVFARGGGSSRSGDVQHAVAAAAQAVGTTQVSSGSVTDGTLTLVMKPGSSTSIQALWEAKVVGRAVAEAVGPGAVAQIAFSDSGSRGDANGGADRVRSLPGVATLSGDGCRARAAAAADAAGALLLGARQVDALGGGCVLVLRPRGDLATFLQDAGTLIGSILQSIPDVQERPYFVSVMNRANAPQLQLGWVPGIGGDYGQGIGWVADGVQSSAVISSVHH
jgi:hypothetical protein